MQFPHVCFAGWCGKKVKSTKPLVKRRWELISLTRLLSLQVDKPLKYVTYGEWCNAKTMVTLATWFHMVPTNIQTVDKGTCA